MPALSSNPQTVLQGRDPNRPVAEDMEGIHPDPHLLLREIDAAVDGIGTRATLEPELYHRRAQVALVD